MGRVIQGYCIEPHAETLAASGVEKLWKPEHLEAAAPTLAGCAVTTHEGEATQYHIGQVLYSCYVRGDGVRYEAEIQDEDIVEAIELGLVQLAPRMKHESLRNNLKESVVPKDIEFTSLFTTPHATDGVPKVGVPGMEPQI